MQYRNFTVHYPKCLIINCDVQVDVFALNPQQIDSLVDYDGIPYTLFGVVYFGGGHFVSRFVCRNPENGDGCVKEYDGMKRHCSMRPNEAASRAECMTVDSAFTFPLCFKSISSVGGMRVESKRIVHFLVYMRVEG
jgi:hypothetical protein